MDILIDGYNVLKQGLGKSQVQERERQQFINQVRTYAQQKGHAITIVFDGGINVWPTAQTKQGMTIIYAGIKQSADDVIKKIMKEAKNKDLLLVSSDNELGRYGQQYRVTSMDAIAFYNLIRHSNTQPSKVRGRLVKTSTEHNLLVDTLMQQSEAPQHGKDEHPDRSRTPPAARPSKQERQLLKKIKKL